jgi:hypothetical protein
MKKYFLFITTGSIILLLNSCREQDSYANETENYVTNQSALSKGDSIASKEVGEVGETDPPKDRDNWRMSY